jgi:hypothetical protein
MDRDDLWQMERDFWGAAGDGDFYREHFAEDGYCVFPIGVLDAAATIAGVEQAQPWTEVGLHDERLLDAGEDHAVLIYSASARREGQDDPYVVHVASHYVRRDGRWLLLLHQQTPHL